MRKKPGTGLILRSRLYRIEEHSFFSVGSDETDGPIGAAGGIVDGETAEKFRKTGLSLEVYLDNYDSYHASESLDALEKAAQQAPISMISWFCL